MFIVSPCVGVPFSKLQAQFFYPGLMFFKKGDGYIFSVSPCVAGSFHFAGSILHMKGWNPCVQNKRQSW
jgi:hypothetical protein